MSKPFFKKISLNEVNQGKGDMCGTYNVQHIKYCPVVSQTEITLFLKYSYFALLVQHIVYWLYFKNMLFQFVKPLSHILRQNKINDS